jgi:hypothetical protein
MGARSGEGVAAAHRGGAASGDQPASGPGGVDPKWAERIRGSDRRALARQFHHEARELHRLLSQEQHRVPAAWRDFRCFLADVGPSPGPRFHLQRTGPAGGPYRSGEVTWTVGRNDGGPAPAQAPPVDPATTYSQWTMVAGMAMQHSELPTRLGVGYGAISSAVAQGSTLDEVARCAQAARAEVEDLSWLSPQEAHQETFRKAYVAWRLKVRPKYLSAATPRFLYLHTLVLAMARCKAVLAEAGLWKPLTPLTVSARDASPAWKTYNELLPKAMTTMAGFDIYRQYSLTEDIEELGERIEAAERRFRGL